MSARKTFVSITVGLIIAFVAVILLSIAKVAWFYVVPTARVSPSLHELSQLTSIRFPASTRMIGSALYRSSTGDAELYAKVGLPREDLASLKASLRALGARRYGLPVPDSKDSDARHLSWWDPSSGRVHQETNLGPRVVRGKMETTRVLICLDKDQRAVVYLFWLRS